MNTLRSLRGEITTRLTEAGFSVLPFLPERIAPPVAIIAAGSPYLESGATYGTFETRFTVILVCATGTNETTTNALDDLLTAAIVSLDGAGWGIERADQPTMLSHGNASYLTTNIDIVTTTGIDDGSD